MIDLKDISMQFAGEYLFRNVNLKINRNDKIALVGANGSGKSTLLRLISGDLMPESGDVLKQKKLRIGFLPQELTGIGDAGVFEAVRSSLQDIGEIENEERRLHNLLENESTGEIDRAEIIVRLGELNHKKEELNYYKIDSEIKKVLSGLGFAPDDFDKPSDRFSGGWQMRIELAKILVSNFDLILLDEPTNHLDLDSLRWLISFLNSYKGSAVIVSHDKFFTVSVTSKTLEIFNNKVTLFNGNYDAYLNFKIERDRRILAEYQNIQKKIKETQKFIDRFRYKATKARQVQSRIKQLDKISLPDLPEFEKEIRVKFPQPPRSNIIPLKLERVSKAFGDKTIFKDIDLEIERGDKIAFVGPNGTGKTTLAKIIADELPPSSGNIYFGDKTIVAYYAQEVAEELNLELDIIDSLTEISEDLTPLEIRTLLGSFLFSDEDIFKKIKVLSGGEKSRVALARVMMQKANLLVLDEPTNHLDQKSKDVLQQAVINFDGSVILVSHDIAFMKPVVNKVFELKNNNTRLIYGGIDYYLEKIISEEKEEFDTNKDDRSTSTPTRREKKRMEAEQRSKRYNMTKDLKDEIRLLEDRIDELEKRKLKAESDLTSEEIFSNPEKLREISAEYERMKSELDLIFSAWTEKSSELEKIESEFDN